MYQLSDKCIYEISDKKQKKRAIHQMISGVHEMYLYDHEMKIIHNSFVSLRSKSDVSE